MEAWSYAQYAGETERTQKNYSIPKNSNSMYMCVCSMHTFYTSPYKD